MSADLEFEIGDFEFTSADFEFEIGDFEFTSADFEFASADFEFKIGDSGAGRDGRLGAGFQFAIGLSHLSGRTKLNNSRAGTGAARRKW